MFAGRGSWYGTYSLDNVTVESNGKNKGQAVTLNKPVTDELWSNHLEGKGHGLGIVPIRDDATCVFGALDIDSYNDFDPAKVARQIAELQIPMVVCRSKSGGAHLYLFASTPIPAVDYRKKLGEIRLKLGLPQKTEVFPKQNALTSEKDAGSWINMPYFDARMSVRYAYSSTGDALSPEDFLDRAETLRQGVEFFEKPLVTKKDKQHPHIPGGPPCLQALTQIKVAMGGRNDGLLNFAIYYRKAFPGEWEEKTRQCNKDFFDPPMDANEVEMVINSAIKNPGYMYTCKRPPIDVHCDGALCRTRPHGVGRIGSSKDNKEEGAPDGRPFPELGQLRKLSTQPPTWFWDINGQAVEFSTEELLTPKLFMHKVSNILTIAPKMPNETKWVGVVDEHMSMAQHIEAPDDSSQRGFFMGLLERFCTGRAISTEKDEVLGGRPYSDGELVWFRMQDLVGFLTKHRFFSLDAPKITAIFHVEGFRQEMWEIRGKTINVWGVPLFPSAKIEVEEKASGEAIL